LFKCIIEKVRKSSVPLFLQNFWVKYFEKTQPKNPRFWFVLFLETGKKIIRIVTLVNLFFIFGDWLTNFNALNYGSSFEYLRSPKFEKFILYVIFLFFLSLEFCLSLSLLLKIKLLILWILFFSTVTTSKN